MSGKNQDSESWRKQNRYRPDGMTRSEAAAALGISVHEAEQLEKQALRKLWLGLRSDEEVIEYSQNGLSIDTNEMGRWAKGPQANFPEGLQLSLVFQSEDIIQR